MCYNHSLFSRSALVVLHRRGFSKIPTSITQKKDLGPRKFGLNGFLKKMFRCPSEYANIYYNQSRVICLSRKFFFFSRGMSIRIIQSTDWTDAEAPVLWPPDEKSWLPGRDPDASKDWGQEEKGVTEDEIVGWHHRLNGHEFKQTPGDSQGQGSLMCCSPWGHKELDMTEWLNNNSNAHRLGKSQISIISVEWPSWNSNAHDYLWNTFCDRQIIDTPPILSYKKSLIIKWQTYRKQEYYKTMGTH